MPLFYQDNSGIPPSGASFPVKNQAGTIDSSIAIAPGKRILFSR